MNEQEMLEAMRTEAKERNENLKKQVSERLKKNAEYNKSNKPCILETLFIILTVITWEVL